MAEETPANPPPANAAPAETAATTAIPAESASPGAATATAPDPNETETVSQEAIDALLKQVGEAGETSEASLEELLKSADFEDATSIATTMPAPEAAAYNLPGFQQAVADAQVSSIDLLRDVELNVKIELGRSRMLVEDILKLGEGSVVELDKLAGDPVDVFVNDRLVARGEVLVLNDNFCVRVNEIVAGFKDEGL